MSEAVTRTLINQVQVNTPLLVANEASIGKITLNDVESLNAKNGFIENLTIKELTVLDEENGNGDSNESYEEATFNGVTLNFGDGYNCKYTTANENTLTSNEDGLAVVAPSAILTTSLYVTPFCSKLSSQLPPSKY